MSELNPKERMTYWLAVKECHTCTVGVMLITNHTISVEGLEWESVFVLHQRPLNWADPTFAPNGLSSNILVYKLISASPSRSSSMPQLWTCKAEDESWLSNGAVGPMSVPNVSPGHAKYPRLWRHPGAVQHHRWTLKMWFSLDSSSGSRLRPKKKPGYLNTVHISLRHYSIYIYHIYP